MFLESKYKIASVRQLLSISFPLMMTVFSTTLMLLCDRLILSRYSLEAMNIATVVGNIYAAIQFVGVKIAYISEVFVGQYNGAKKYHKVALPVWQMLWFSIALFVFTVPIALYTGKSILPRQFWEEGIGFYKLLIATAPFLAMTAALASFYVGRGQMRIVTFTVIIANIINIVLDWIFVLGVEGFIKPMGINGAAYATIISNLVQVIILLFAFLKKSNDDVYNTRHIIFDKKLFIKCLRLGTPSAVGIALDISAWSVMLLVLAHLKTEFLTVHTIALTIFLFFNFFIDGLQKGITAIASNIIGIKKLKYLNKLMNSSLLLYSSIIIFLFFPLILFSNHTVSLFIKDSSNFDYIIAESENALKYVWVFFIVDGLFWSYTGVLTAAGDTKFLMIVYAASIFCLLLIPVYVMAQYFDVTPSSLWFIISIYKIIPTLLFINRYSNGRWKTINIED